ncbi:phospholipase D-like domain-containing protein [Marmoricola sp. RAF53]|uniref:phospholipase D-like domain-containing protein n=1 Tax=Marmoricola sp. RAF53 TaxID=3233059 RepID=UPI003F959DCC
MDQRRARTIRAVVGTVAMALACTLVPDLALAAEPVPAQVRAPVVATPAFAAAPVVAAAAGAVSTLRTPDHFTPPQGVKFNHWNIKRYRYVIRRHMLRTINSVPSGGTIRWIVFSFGETKIYNALNEARKRGVSVQILGNFHNRETWEPWRRMERTFGTSKVRKGKNPERISWARMCSKSCRGWGGHVHLKLFLFSKVGNATGVTMYGSWNPTWVANDRQWNHLETTWDPTTYAQYLRIFRQAKRDKPVPAAHFVAGGNEHWVFPKTGTRASNDPVNVDLAKVRCTGVTNGTGNGGRTMIRIGMYAWYAARGDWLARRVRALWNQGCDVAIIYGIMSDRARRTLYSPSGRGRIPMKQAMVPDANGVPYRYLHDKFVVLSGVYGTQTDARVTWAGSTNFSNLGFSADDMTVRTMNPAVAGGYFADWRITWNGPNVHAPHPGGVIHAEGRTADGRYSNQLPTPLGTGIYRNLEAD